VFLRPTILRSREDIQGAAAQRYTRVQQSDVTEPRRSILNETEVNNLPMEIRGLY